MIAAVDDSIGEIVQALKLKQLWENTLIIFSSDNGGPADHANNWPLR
jgi:arylsulfatase A-like enzyme